MPYRPTDRTEARRAAARERIVSAASQLVAHGGYREARLAAVAERAGVATGSVYRHFTSKADLFAEVFRRASQREVDAVRAAVDAVDGPAADRVAVGVETFARRALRGRRLAWALLAEPVDPAVEAERLAFRRAYRDVFASVLIAGMASGELAVADPDLAAAALVGAIGEAMVGPLSPASQAGAGDDALVRGLVALCLRAVTEKEPARVDAVA
jgi:AcrR family transcriptional regulator